MIGSITKTVQFFITFADIVISDGLGLFIPEGFFIIPDRKMVFSQVCIGIAQVKVSGRKGFIDGDGKFIRLDGLLEQFQVIIGDAQVEPGYLVIRMFIEK